jgi:hypothetical protein
VPAHFTSAPCLISEAMCTTSRLFIQVKCAAINECIGDYALTENSGDWAV